MRLSPDGTGKCPGADRFGLAGGSERAVHLEAAGYAIQEGLAVRLSISVMAMLVALIGGRVVPSFTRNWFAKNDGPEIVQPMGVFDKVSLVVSVAALGVWIVIAESQVAGGCLVVTGLLHLVRLARWRGWQTTGEGLVTILHVAYFVARNRVDAARSLDAG
jgi:uncharacterized protein involved in response to NO